MNDIDELDNLITSLKKDNLAEMTGLLSEIRNSTILYLLIASGFTVAGFSTPRSPEDIMFLCTALIMWFLSFQSAKFFFSGKKELLDLKSKLLIQ